MSLRGLLFWIFDCYHHSSIRRHYNDLKRRLNDQDTTSDMLDRLLCHAVESTPYYKSYRGKTQLEAFPIINKAIIKEHFKDFIAEGFDPNDLKATTTSGSTGTPFTVYKNSDKMARHIAAMILFNEKANLPLGQRLYYLRVWNRMNRKGWKTQYLQNIIPIEVSHFGEQEVTDLVRRILGYKGPVSILGFASALTDLSRLAVDLPEMPRNIRSVISMSEHLPDTTRNRLRKLFRCPVLSRYSNTENGFIAQQTADSDYYEINTADFKIELLDLNDDKPVKNGEMGRVVITDLYNYAMPLIRYDTGDTAVCDVVGGQPVFTSIEGRTCDLVFDTSGKPMSPHFVTNTLWEYRELLQYQFIQRTERQYVVKLCLSGCFEREEKLKQQLLSYLGEDAEVSFEYVDELPVLQSGKRRSVINEWKK